MPSACYRPFGTAARTHIGRIQASTQRASSACSGSRVVGQPDQVNRTFTTKQDRSRGDYRAKHDRARRDVRGKHDAGPACRLSRTKQRSLNGGAYHTKPQQDAVSSFPFCVSASLSLPRGNRLPQRERRTT